MKEASGVNKLVANKPTFTIPQSAMSDGPDQLPTVQLAP